MIVSLIVLVVLLALAVIGGCVSVLWLALRERYAFFKAIDLRMISLENERNRAVKQQETLSERFIQAVEKLISYAREEHEAGAVALKMAALIDARVEARVTKITIDANTGSVIAQPAAKTKSRSFVGEQPQDPNVRQSSIIDEVHEAERDAERVLNPDIEYSVRDERRDVMMG